MKPIQTIMIAGLLHLAGAFAAFAASSAWIDNGPNRYRLVMAEPAPGEREVRGMLDIDLASGWKTYWKDPGDAGVPLQISLDGSDNAANIRTEFPLPARHDDGVTVWAGYDGAVQIPFTFERPDPAQGGTLKATVFFGICEKICIPVNSTFSLPFSVTEQSTTDSAIVAQAFDRLPQPAGQGSGITGVEISNDTLLINTSMAKSSARDLFLAAPAGWQFAAPVTIDSKGADARFSARILLRPPNSGSADVMLDYTLAGNGEAVSGTFNFSAK